MSETMARTRIKATSNGFILSEEGVKDKPETKGDFAIFTNEPNTVVDHCWFRGGLLGSAYNYLENYYERRNKKRWSG